MPYASHTIISIPDTIEDIKKIILQNEGRPGFCSHSDTGGVIEFTAKGTPIRFGLMYTTPITLHSGRTAKDEQRRKAEWRALFLTIKAKFVSVASGIESFHEAFMGCIVQPDYLVAA